MKNLHTTTKQWTGLTLSLLAIVFLLSSCSKNNNDNRIPRAGFMAFNLAPDKPAIGYTLSGNQLAYTPLGYTSYTGNYLPISIGQREVRTFDFNNGNTIATSQQSFLDSAYYSAFLVGAVGVYSNVIVRDEFENVLPVTGKAWVRYINAVTDTTARPNITIGTNTETTVFGSVSSFTEVNAGNLDITIENGSNFRAERTITVAENNIYTILFVGQPGQSDPNLAVQIKYIQNGIAN
ncbi:MAG TPA: hypothetical protein PK504_05110 [Ferruginibacter sp.]|nr:hypothetical protein [Ferruginibacter sp.]